MFGYSPLPSVPDVVVISSRLGKAHTVVLNLLCKAVSFSFGQLEQIPYGMYFTKCKNGEGVEVGVWAAGQTHRIFIQETRVHVLLETTVSITSHFLNLSTLFLYLNLTKHQRSFLKPSRTISVPKFIKMPQLFCGLNSGKVSCTFYILCVDIAWRASIMWRAVLPKCMFFFLFILKLWWHSEISCWQISLVNFVFCLLWICHFEPEKKRKNVFLICLFCFN